MRKLLLPCLLAFALLFSGCYQAKVTTGRDAGGETMTMRKTGFINGLVMQGMPVDGASQCQNGVASVTTKLTVVDQFLAALTGGLYSPMTVQVTCASGGMSSLMPAPEIDFTLPEDATKAEVEETITAAAQESATTQQPVQVKVVD
jgi:hypothetical protein